MSQKKKWKIIRIKTTVKSKVILILSVFLRNLAVHIHDGCLEENFEDNLEENYLNLCMTATNAALPFM